MEKDNLQQSQERSICNKTGESNFGMSNTTKNNLSIYNNDNVDPYYIKTNNFNYGQNYLSDKSKNSLKELGESAIKLHYLEKSLKSKRRLEQRQNQTIDKVDEEFNEKYKYDKNAVVSKKFPFKADEFKSYGDNLKPKSLYVKYSEEYGKHKPNQLELPDKFFPKDDKFTRAFTYNYKNNSLNCAPSNSKTHSNFDSVY